MIRQWLSERAVTALLPKQIVEIGGSPRNVARTLNDVRVAAQIDRSRLIGLFLTSLGIVAAETISIGLIYPALTFLEKGPQNYLASMPVPMRVAIDFVQSFGISVGLGALLLMALAPVLLRTVLQLLRDRVVTSIVHTGISNMRAMLFKEVLRANLNFHRDNPSARVHMAIVTNINGSSRLIPEMAIMLSSSIQVLLLFGLLALISLPVAVLATVLLAVLGLAYRFYFRAGGALARDNVDGYIKLKLRTLESLQNTRLIKAYGMEDKAANMFNRNLSQVFATDFKINFFSSAIESTTVFLFASVSLLLFYVGATYFAMTLSGLGLFMVVLLRIQPAVGLLGRSFFNIATGLEFWAETKKLLSSAAAAREPYGSGAAFEQLRSNLKFDNVCFSYRTAGRIVPAVKNLNLTIKQGEIVGIVGKSGAGKSTLIDLIPRFIEAESGVISIDGVSIGDFDIQSLRKGIGYVPQEPMMFDDTIRSNLTYGLDREVSDKTIEAALKAAHGMDIIEGMVQGLATTVGDRGARLSGGQRQRLALARAILAENSILILDEPTNALDVQSEMGVRQTILDLKGKVTVIIIAHRLDTVQIADRILLVRDGSLADEGTHTDLEARNAHYRDLFNLGDISAPATENV